MQVQSNLRTGQQGENSFTNVVLAIRNWLLEPLFRTSATDQDMREGVLNITLSSASEFFSQPSEGAAANQEELRDLCNARAKEIYEGALEASTREQPSSPLTELAELFEPITEGEDSAPLMQTFISETQVGDESAAEAIKSFQETSQSAGNYLADLSLNSFAEHDTRALMDLLNRINGVIHNKLAIDDKGLQERANLGSAAIRRKRRTFFNDLIQVIKDWVLQPLFTRMLNAESSNQDHRIEAIYNKSS